MHPFFWILSNNVVNKALYSINVESLVLNINSFSIHIHIRIILLFILTSFVHQLKTLFDYQ